MTATTQKIRTLERLLNIQWLDKQGVNGRRFAKHLRETTIKPKVLAAFEKTRYIWCGLNWWLSSISFEKSR